MISLRPHQIIGREEILQHFINGYKSVLYQLATGGGKTRIAADIIQRTEAKGRTALFLCNRIELVDQTVIAFNSLGINPGIIAADYAPDYTCPIQIGSVDTVIARLKTAPFPADLIVHDEARGVAAAGWSSIFTHYHDKYHIGLDATPERGDGKPLTPYFQQMVTGPSIKELIAAGYLVPPRCYAPDAPDVSKVRIMANGDYDPDELEAIMNKPSITGSAIQHYLQHGKGRQAIFFCVNLSHSEQLAEDFNAYGISAEHIDGKPTPTKRRAIMEAYRAGKTMILTNMRLVSCGLDVPNVSYIGDLSPTSSISDWLQRCGRGARTAENKEYYIYADHAGNIQRHQMLPHDDREWSLAGKKKGKRTSASEEKEMRIRTCSPCGYSHDDMTLTICPDCHTPYPIQERKVELKPGELKEIQAIEKRNKRMEVGRASTKEEIMAIARERNYNKGWIWHQMKIKGLL